MYENQETYIAKKKQFTQQEFEFQTREHELREEDHKLQQSLITYATFLDNNAKVMRNCDQNIAKLNEECKQREGEIQRKHKQLEILRAKKQRIDRQRGAVEKYQIFLEEVKNLNSDDYTEVNEISDRHHTLDSTSRSLDHKLKQISQRLDDKKNEVSSYEREMDNKIMSLNNKIAKLTTECDDVEAQKSQLQSSEEDGQAKKLAQQSELSQVIFAIDMIESSCKGNEYQ